MGMVFVCRALSPKSGGFGLAPEHVELAFQVWALGVILYALCHGRWVGEGCRRSLGLSRTGNDQLKLLASCY